MEESKPIRSLPKFYLGFVFGIPGLFFMILDESWLAVISNIFGNGLLEHSILKMLVEYFPVIMFIGGLSLILKAREKRKIGVSS